MITKYYWFSIILGSYQWEKKYLPIQEKKDLLIQIQIQILSLDLAEDLVEDLAEDLVVGIAIVITIAEDTMDILEVEELDLVTTLV